MRLTYTQSQTSDCGLLVCKDGDIFWSRNICIWHVGDITQFMGQRLLSMWHDIGPATVTSCSTTHWSLACMVADVRKMDKQISATQYQLPGSMSTPCNQSQLLRTVTPEPNTMHKRTIRISHEDCLAAIEDSPDLSADTKAKYMSCLNRIVRGGPGRRGGSPTPAIIPNTSLLWCITHPENTSQLLQQALAARGCLTPTSLHNYIASLMSVMAHHPELQKLTEIRGRWKAAAEKLTVTPLEQKAKANQPSERQRQGFVTYAELAAKFLELCKSDLGSRDCLLVGLVGSADHNVMPQRRDFGAVRLYIGTSPTPEQANTGNYLVVQRDSAGKLAGHIILNEYKTARKYGPQRIDLHALFIQALLASLEKDPRDWLFTMQVNKKVPRNTPYTDDGFGQMATKAFKRLFGKPLTLSGVRHSFITHLHCSQYWAELSDAQREVVAQKMGHSYATSCRYRYVGCQ